MVVREIVRPIVCWTSVLTLTALFVRVTVLFSVRRAISRCGFSPASSVDIYLQDVIVVVCVRVFEFMVSRIRQALVILRRGLMR
jgi:hypothetical protein